MREYYRCQKCGAVLGKLVTRDGVRVLEIRGFTISVLYAVCGCGEKMYYHADMEYQKLLQAIANTR